MYVFRIDESWPAQKTPGTRLLKITTRTAASWCRPDTNSRIYTEKCEATSGRDIDKTEKWSQDRSISQEQRNIINLAYFCHFFFIFHIWIYCCQKMNYGFLQVQSDFDRFKKKFFFKRTKVSARRRVDGLGFWELLNKRFIPWKLASVIILEPQTHDPESSVPALDTSEPPQCLRKRERDIYSHSWYTLFQKVLFKKKKVCTFNFILPHRGGKMVLVNIIINDLTSLGAGGGRFPLQLQPHASGLNLPQLIAS